MVQPFAVCIIRDLYEKSLDDHDFYQRENLPGHYHKISLTTHIPSFCRARICIVLQIKSKRYGEIENCDSSIHPIVAGTRKELPYDAYMHVSRKHIGSLRYQKVRVWTHVQDTRCSPVNFRSTASKKAISNCEIILKCSLYLKAQSRFPRHRSPFCWNVRVLLLCDGNNLIYILDKCNGKGRN